MYVYMDIYYVTFYTTNSGLYHETYHCADSPLNKKPSQQPLHRQSSAGCPWAKSGNRPISDTKQYLYLLDEAVLVYVYIYIYMYKFVYYIYM